MTRRSAVPDVTHLVKLALAARQQLDDRVVAWIEGAPYVEADHLRLKLRLARCEARLLKAIDAERCAEELCRAWASAIDIDASRADIGRIEAAARRYERAIRDGQRLIAAVERARLAGAESDRAAVVAILKRRRTFRRLDHASRDREIATTIRRLSRARLMAKK